MRDPQSRFPTLRDPRFAVLVALSLAVATPVGLAAVQGDSVSAPGRGLVGEPAPSRWRTAAGAVLILGSLALLDEPVRDLTRDLRGGFGDGLGDAGSRYGDWQSTLPFVVGGSLLVGALTEGGAGAGKGAAAVMGVLAGALANEGVNQALGRRRPSEDLGTWQFEPFHGHASLGSGHTAYTFAIAGAVDEVTDGWIAVPLYAAATLTGLSRIYDDRHWLSDVAVGGFIGWWTSRRATRTATGLLGVSRELAGPASGPPPSGLGALLARLELVAGGSILGLQLTF